MWGAHSKQYIPGQSHHQRDSAEDTCTKNVSFGSLVHIIPTLLALWMALVFQQMALFNHMMTLGRWYYLVSVLRTLRRDGVKEFIHNLTPNEWVQLQFTLDSKPRSFSEGTQDISRHRLHKMNLFILREVWRDTSLWKHNLNCALEIRIELAACKAYSCIHQGEVTSSLGQCPRQKWQLLEQTSSPTKPRSHDVNGQECEFVWGK